MTLPRAILALIVAMAATPAGAATATPLALVAPGSGAVRALVVGVDRYRHVTPLRGATADALDIKGALSTMGAVDLTVLSDEQVDRARLLGEFERLVGRTRSGDLVIITIAGHGAKEDERVKGSSTDGSDEVFLLPGFDPKTGPGGAEKILNHEFNHYIKKLEGQGAQVIFLADTCYGGGLAREVVIDAPGISYRQVPRYRLAEDDLKPVSTPADALLTDLDFQRTTFLAAVDSETKAPEVLIDNAYRGALSYAFARALQGAADQGRDHKTTLREFFSYLRKVVYQLSDERQNIVTSESPHRDLDHDVVLQWGERGIDRPARPAVLAPPADAPRKQAPLRLASATGSAGVFAGLEPLEAAFEIVGPEAAPDLVWNPVSHEAVSGGDKVALDVGLDDLAGVIDRTAAVRDLKSLVVRAPQAMQILPDASLHRNGSRVDVEIGDLAGRNLVLVDVTGSGVVQLIYPTKGQTTGAGTAGVRFPFKVRDPFGADQVLAITSVAPLDKLVAALRDLDKRRSAGRLFDTVTQLSPSEARFGLVGLFTIP